MSQLDWVGSSAQPQQARVIRNTRPSVAEEKARLALELGDLINRIPPPLRTGGTVNAVRQWRAARDAAAKVAGNSRASVHDLAAAITSMRRFFAEAAGMSGASIGHVPTQQRTNDATT